MKQQFKQFLKSDFVLTALTVLIAYYIRLVYATSRITVICDSDASRYMESEENAIFCFWHGRLLMVPCVRPKKRVMHVLVSHHNDGEIITRVVRNLGVDSVRGSSSQGGREALRNMVRILEAGNNIGITPDGPRGPAEEAVQGAAQLAKISGKVLIPVTYSASRCKRMKSWDRFMVPYPFTKLTYMIGAPIAMQGTGKDAVAKTTEALQAQMRDLTARCDARGEDA